MTRYVFGIILLLALFATSCKTKQKTASMSTMPDNSMTSLDWSGTYSNMLPCADCPGIQTVIQLKEDLTYVKLENYLGKDQKMITTRDNFTWNKQGNIITLENQDLSPNSYLVGENKLIQLDVNGKQISRELTEKYILNKVPEGLVEKYWKLTELHGDPIIRTENNKREAHLVIKQDGNRVVGNAGCNSLTASYKLDEENRLSFGQIATTKMACMDMTVENEFLKVLPMVDSYQIEDDTLYLLKTGVDPLARLEAVYLY